MDLVYKLAVADDMDKLWLLVEESLSGLETRITFETLQRDLFGSKELELENAMNRCKDPSIEFDIPRAQQISPICYAIIAQTNGELVGYLMFHQFYSPWKSRGVYIDHIYVQPDHRRKGIASGFLQKLEENCRAENLAYLLYDASRLDDALEKALLKYRPTVYRDDNTDWSVYRIELEDRDK